MTIYHTRSGCLESTYSSVMLLGFLQGNVARSCNYFAVSALDIAQLIVNSMLKIFSSNWSGIKVMRQPRDINFLEGKSTFYCLVCLGLAFIQIVIGYDCSEFVFMEQ